MTDPIEEDPEFEDPFEEPEEMLPRVFDARLDPRDTSFKHIDVTDQPNFEVGEVARMFFGRSADWLRQQEVEGYTPEARRRPKKDDKSKMEPQRCYNLQDIEEVADALFAKERISVERYYLAKRLVRLVARVNEYPIGELGSTVCVFCERVLTSRKPIARFVNLKNEDGPWVHVSCLAKHREKQRQISKLEARQRERDARREAREAEDA